MGKAKPNNFYQKQKEIQSEKAAQRSQQGSTKGQDPTPEKEFVIPSPDSQSNISQNAGKKASKSSDLRSQFKKLDPSELENSKLEAMKPLETHGKSRCIRLEEMYPSSASSSTAGSSTTGDHFSIPVRPPFSLDDSKEELEEREHAYFAEWKRCIVEAGGDSLSYFEQNIEVWRQLWRVVEMSDILLVIVDARNPLFHIPPQLYNYVVNTSGKKMLLILNKTDLVPEDTLKAWESYLTTIYPSISISRFSCYPEFDDKEIQSLISKNKIKLKSFRRFYRASGILEIIQKCSELVPVKKQAPVDWAGLEQRIRKNLEERETKSLEAVSRAAAGRGGIRHDKSSKARRRRQLEADLEG